MSQRPFFKGTKEFLEVLAATLLLIFVGCLVAIPLIYHVMICVEMILDEGSWIAFAFLVFGTTVFPIGWIHGALSMAGVM